MTISPRQYTLIEEDDLPPHRHTLGTHSDIDTLLAQIRDYLENDAEFPLIIEWLELPDPK